ncbi:DUF1329 domain-containing protein [Oceanobacter mangrovi]|uniref:DUF1329 domain-containing protein n=1 Tax=Oceanobacter mangrovi TaxID=2862510 RepID=UPI001C8E7D3B|nr:DUF1329 domain-containing protein [Oceanobacter mangrovi]
MLAAVCLSLGTPAVWSASLSEQLLQQRQQQADRLTTDLTPVGAERAASVTGIPPWRGGVRLPPPGFSGELIDPYEAESQLITIDRNNMAAFIGQLSAGLGRLLVDGRRYIRVFPTHRSAAAPDRIYEQAYRNLLRAEKNLGGGILYTAGAIPFPIPQSAEDVLWNQWLSWRGERWLGKVVEWQVINGQQQRLDWQVEELWPYYLAGMGCHPGCDELMMKTSLESAGRLLMSRRWQQDSTASESGGMAEMAADNPSGRVWQQTLTMGAQPELKTAGLGDWPENWDTELRSKDDVELFSLLPGDYYWLLLGKQEMLVPYNNYQYASHLPDPVELAGLGGLRFEKHRVWVIDGSLRKGRQNQYSKRVYYIDEDSWQITQADFYDKDGELVRVGLNVLVNDYRIPAVLPVATLIIEPVSGSLDLLYKMIN